MEFNIKAINFDADVYDVRKALELVLHGPGLYDPNDPINKGRTPNFEVVLHESPARRIHNGTGILRVTNVIGNNLHSWIEESSKNKVLVKGRALRLLRSSCQVSPLVRQQLEKAFYVGPEKEKRRKTIESQATQVHLRIAKVQFGVWYRQPNSPPNHGRAFSIEYEHDSLSQSEAYISVVYEQKLIRIEVGITPSLAEPQLYLIFHSTQIGQRETEEYNHTILVKFSTIRKLGTGNDDFGQPGKRSCSTTVSPYLGKFDD
jgi:RNA-dependent RNA polymerase